MARTVAYSFGHSVVQSFPIAATRDTSEVLLNIAPFLVSDWADVGTVFQTAIAQRKLTGSVSLDEKRSSLQSLHLFGGNLEADVRLTFQSPRNLGLETLADYRSIPIGIHYSLRQLPAVADASTTGRRPGRLLHLRLKDSPRDTADNYFIRYINRWRLEKKQSGRRPERAGPADRVLHRPHRPARMAARHSRRDSRMEPRLRGRRLSRRDPRNRRRRTTARGARRTRAIRRCGGPRPTARPTPSRPSMWTPGPVRSSTPTSSSPPAWIQRWRGQSGRYVAPVSAVRTVLQEDSLASGAGAARGSAGSAKD